MLDIERRRVNYKIIIYLQRVFNSLEVFSAKKHYSSVIIGITIDLCQWYFANLLLFRSFFHFFFEVFYAVL